MKKLKLIASYQFANFLQSTRVSIDVPHIAEKGGDMIKDLLPRFYEAHGMDPTYTTLRSIFIDGHEVAWMRVGGTIQNDYTGRGREGKPYTGHELCCECDFTENVGWKTEGDTVFGLLGPNKCIYRDAAEYLRHLEIRQEYLKKFKDAHGDRYFLQEKIPEIIFDLIRRVKAGEFVEDGGGAASYGGYFYVQTIASILGCAIAEGENFILHDPFTIWQKVRELVEDKKIDLEGAIIQLYRKPKSPAWKELLKIKDAGWTGVASLPAHSKMKCEWKLELWRPDGCPVDTEISGLALIHDPTFGPDTEDVARVEEALRKLIDEAKKCE